MNLRPKLAADFADAIMNDLQGRRGCLDGVDADIQAEMRKEWTALLLERFTSHQVADVAEFLEKYPQLQRLIDLAQAEARERFEGVTFEMKLSSLHDSCGTCYEGQYLSLEILTTLADNSFTANVVESESPFEEADEAWLDWMCSDDSSYRKLKLELGEVEDLLHIRLLTEH